MPPIDLADANLQLDWATQKLIELGRRVDAYRSSNPYEIVFPEKAGTNRLAVQVRSTVSVPNDIRMIAGDAIHSLRVPLDYLACQLALVNGEPTKGVAFPFGKDALSYAEERKRKLSKLSEKGRAFVDNLEPYMGGKGNIFSLLHQLDIGHKHLDIVALGARSRTSSIGFSQVINGDAHIEYMGMDYESLSTPLELMTISKGATLRGSIVIDISIGFGPGEVAAGLELVTTMEEIRNRVRDTLNAACNEFS